MIFRSKSPVSCAGGGFPLCLDICKILGRPEGNDPSIREPQSLVLPLHYGRHMLTCRSIIAYSADKFQGEAGSLMPLEG